MGQNPTSTSNLHLRWKSMRENRRIVSSASPWPAWPLGTAQRNSSAPPGFAGVHPQSCPHAWSDSQLPNVIWTHSLESLLKVPFPQMCPNTPSTLFNAKIQFAGMFWVMVQQKVEQGGSKFTPALGEVEGVVPGISCIHKSRDNSPALLLTLIWATYQLRNANLSLSDFTAQRIPRTQTPVGQIAVLFSDYSCACIYWFSIAFDECCSPESMGNPGNFKSKQIN